MISSVGCSAEQETGGCQSSVLLLIFYLFHYRNAINSSYWLAISFTIGPYLSSSRVRSIRFGQSTDSGKGP